MACGLAQSIKFRILAGGITLHNTRPRSTSSEGRKNEVVTYAYAKYSFILFYFRTEYCFPSQTSFCVILYI